MGIISAPSSFPLQKSLFPLANLIAFWNLDGLSNATIIGANFGNFSLNRFGTTYTTVVGKIRNGVFFNGSSQGMFTNQQLWNRNTNPTVSFTVSFWWRIPNNNVTQTIMGNAFGTMGFHFDYYNTSFPVASRGVSFRTLRTGSPLNWNATFHKTLINANEWTHICGTYNNSTSTMNLYVNGSLVDTNSSATFTSVQQTTWHGFALNGSVRLSDKEYGDLQNYDAVGFWNRALTQDEVTVLYNNGNGLQFPINEILITRRGIGGGKIILN